MTASHATQAPNTRDPATTAPAPAVAQTASGWRRSVAAGLIAAPACVFAGAGAGPAQTLDAADATARRGADAAKVLLVQACTDAAASCAGWAEAAAASIRHDGDGAHFAAAVQALAARRG